MANEITITANLSAVKGSLSVRKDSTLRVTMAGTASMDNVQNIGTAYEQIVIPAEIATAGYAWVRNLDTTNYVEIGVVVAATFYPLMVLKAGEMSLVRFATTTFYAKANTAAVNLEICLLQD